jgi:microcystin-dependent protein
MQVYVGQVLLVGFNFAPLGWAPCDGRLLSISEYQILYSLLGTTYGGNGQTTFGLPDLRGRTAIGLGPSKSGSNYVLGQNGGAENVTVTSNTYPLHSHSIGASKGTGNLNAAAGAALASGQTIYVSNPTLTAPLNSLACTASPGGSLPHNNLQPYLTLNWIIALDGIYPSQG